MSKRSLATLLLTIAFLVSAWGNVIAAAFCPRYMSNRECAVIHHTQQPKPVKSQSSCHEGMTDMDDMQMDMPASESPKTEDEAVFENSPTGVVTESSAEPGAINLLSEPCGHCWMHSQPASGTATLVAVDPAKQLVDTNAPPADSSVILPNAFTATITPLEHGPPGNGLPRHVLINVFRI